MANTTPHHATKQPPNTPPSVPVSDDYFAELVQVAAVAVAMIEHHLAGVADINNADSRRKAVFAVLDERRNQQRKFGPQAHSPAVWLAILAEEVAELAGETPLPVAVGRDGTGHDARAAVMAACLEAAALRDASLPVRFPDIPDHVGTNAYAAAAAHFFASGVRGMEYPARLLIAHADRVNDLEVES